MAIRNTRTRRGNYENEQYESEPTEGEPNLEPSVHGMQTLANQVVGLQSELAAARAQAPTIDAEQEDVFEKIASYPQFRLGLILSALALRFWLCSSMFAFVALKHPTLKAEWHNNFPWLCVQIGVGTALYWWIPYWGCQENVTKNPGSVFFKSLSLLVGTAIALADYSGTYELRLWAHTRPHLGAALFDLVVLGLVVECNLFAKISDKLANDEGAIFRGLRNWFA